MTLSARCWAGGHDRRPPLHYRLSGALSGPAAFTADEQNRDIYRHPAGTLATVNKAGYRDLHCTGSMYLRIGQAIENEDLAPPCATETGRCPSTSGPLSS
jgi:hypothetical protein